MSERWNSEGVPRADLIWVLTQRSWVMKARKLNSCLLCKSSPVNEAGLCDVCWASLDEKELYLATKWLTGVGP